MGAFVEAARADGLTIIADIKRRDAHTAQWLLPLNRAVADRTQMLITAGAKALSVVLDPMFAMNEHHVMEATRVAEHNEIPVLVKGFFSHPLQINYIRQLGANAVLLMPEQLSAKAMHDCYESALSLGMDIVIESARLGDLEGHVDDRVAICLNRRDLNTGVIGNDGTLEPSIAAMRAKAGNDTGIIVASGVKDTHDIKLYKDLPGRVDAALVGTYLLKHLDPMQAFVDLKEAANG